MPGKKKQELSSDDYAAMAKAADELAARGAGAKAHLNGMLAEYYRAMAAQKRA